MGNTPPPRRRRRRWLIITGAALVLVAVTGCDSGHPTPTTTTTPTEAWDPCTGINDQALHNAGLDPATKDTNVEGPPGWKFCGWKPLGYSDLRTRWQYRANEAKAGRFRIDPHVAQMFSDECEKLIAGLLEAKKEIRQAGNIHGLGNFKCADQLTVLLQKPAVGDEGSIESVIDTYLDIAHLGLVLRGCDSLLGRHDRLCGMMFRRG